MSDRSIADVLLESWDRNLVALAKTVGFTSQEILDAKFQAFFTAAKVYYSWSPGDEKDLKDLGRSMDAAGFALFSGEGGL